MVASAKRTWIFGPRERVGRAVVACPDQQRANQSCHAESTLWKG